MKFSNERDPRFALRTEICQKGKYARYVRKTADTAAAEAHIRNLENIGENWPLSMKRPVWS